MRAVARSIPAGGRRVPGRALVRPGTVTSRPLTGLVPLVHTVRRPTGPVRSLMRTVLRDTSHRFTGGLVRSPALSVRASGRSPGLLRRTLVGTGFNPYFVIPQLDARALACARRSIRREVLFATGRGGGRHRPPSYRSKWRC